MSKTLRMHFFLEWRFVFKWIISETWNCVEGYTGVLRQKKKINKSIEDYFNVGKHVKFMSLCSNCCVLCSVLLYSTVRADIYGSSKDRLRSVQYSVK